MKIGIIDAEIMGKNKHRFPNLVCMKLSAYYKNLGNSVDLILDYFSFVYKKLANVNPSIYRI